MKGLIAERRSLSFIHILVIVVLIVVIISLILIGASYFSGGDSAKARVMIEEQEDSNRGLSYIIQLKSTTNADYVIIESDTELTSEGGKDINNNGKNLELQNPGESIILEDLQEDTKVKISAVSDGEKSKVKSFTVG